MKSKFKGMAESIEPRNEAIEDYDELPEEKEKTGEIGQKEMDDGISVIEVEMGSGMSPCKQQSLKDFLRGILGLMS